MNQPIATRKTLAGRQYTHNHTGESFKITKDDPHWAGVKAKSTKTGQTKIIHRIMLGQLYIETTTLNQD